jgi:dTDP-4-amino-4,6-dideoxygalactose transaminase
MMGGGHADLVNSGTSAVYVALGALCLPPGSEVVVPPITDPGGCMPVCLHNLIPVFKTDEGRTLIRDAHWLRHSNSRCKAERGEAW